MVHSSRLTRRGPGRSRSWAAVPRDGSIAQGRDPAVFEAVQGLPHSDLVAFRRLRDLQHRQAASDQRTHFSRSRKPSRLHHNRLVHAAATPEIDDLGHVVVLSRLSWRR
jgi:hypothetical protein